MFEVDTLNSFKFKHILGKPCSTSEQAQQLMWPLLSEEQRAGMASVAGLPSWTSVQAEFTQGSFAFESRIAVMSLPPDPELKVGDHLLQKMKKIIFPMVKFSGVSLGEAVEYLNSRSESLCPSEDGDNGHGVRIEIDANLPPHDSQFSLDLKDVPMDKALRYLVGLAGLKFKLAPDRVLVVDRSDVGALPHITFHFQITGQQPIALADFDVVAFIKHFRDTHTKGILAKLAPHLAPL